MEEVSQKDRNHAESLSLVETGLNLVHDLIEITIKPLTRRMVRQMGICDEEQTIAVDMVNRHDDTLDQ
ncbi:hypothetical protein SYK_22110 [Pseudodesulfovibrio nedwellii]|uniref:Uncharacterized protein n=1 Tax=Pseudodesulfovibrio nedwellii TaxID=2973072 RepID=A0ABM8B221_9BACT|nr:hypothetical protein SYK_22110 [Pseudodesulfovibrio nedwellii]